MPTIIAPPVGPVLGAQGSVQAAYGGEIAWSSVISGTFQIDRSTVGGTDTIGASSFSQSFTGQYDSLLANGLRLEEFQTTRGKSDDLTQAQAGTAELTVLDYSGILNPKSTTSPLYGFDVAGRSSVRPKRPGRIRMIYNGVSYPIFYGFVRTIEYDPGIRVGHAKIEMVDLFSWLDTPQDDGSGSSPLPVIPRVLNTTTGAAIGLILDSIGWTDLAMRLIDSGDALPYFEATGDQTPLALISDLVAANGGLFYIDAAGRAVFEDRNTRWLRTSYASIVNTMQAITPGSTSDSVTNAWTATRSFEATPGDPTSLTDSIPQVASDQASEREFGVLSQEIGSKYWPSDTFALGAAQWRLLQTKDPITPIWNLQLDNRDDNQMLAIAQAELLRRISVSEARTGTSGDYFIEQIGHAFSRADRRHTCGMILSERQATMVPFIIGSDTIGDTAILGF